MARSAIEIRDAVARGEASAVEVCQAYLERIAAFDNELHAFTTVTGESALETAAHIDRTRGNSSSAPLLGIPIAIKDNICTRGIRITACSRMLETFVAPYEATAVTKLKAAGAVIIGKTNCDEFAMGSTTEHSAFGPTRNPWAPDRIPGGSSGGSAAAVAARFTPLALGSDTGGSIRQPAAHTGIVGLKPTYGRVSRYGLIAFASSLDQIGTLTLTVRDAALVLEVIGGPDPRDATSADETIPRIAAALDGDARNARIGVPRAFIEEGVDEQVARAFHLALDQWRARGVTLVDIELPHARYAIPVYYLIAPAEASSNLARYDGVRYTFRAPLEPSTATLTAMYDRTRDLGFGSEVKRRIMLGTYVLSAGHYEAYYLKAQQVRTLIRRDYERAFESVDAVVMPTSPTPAFRIGERTDDPLQIYLTDVFTVSANLTGLPAISVPCGFTREKLPVGIQLVGRPFDELTICRLADAYEREAPWGREEPVLTHA